MAQSSNRVGQICFISYPESMGDLYDKIQSMGLTVVRSPLHDKDINEETGELKKPHYHNMMIFSGLKSEKQIKEICELLDIKHYEVPIDKRGMLRYFCHLDVDENSGKCIYPVEDVKCFGGFDYNSVLTAKDGKPSTSTPLFRLCKDMDFRSFREFVDYVAQEMPNHIDQVISQAYFWNLYVRPRDQN